MKGRRKPKARPASARRRAGPGCAARCRRHRRRRVAAPSPARRTARRRRATLAALDDRDRALTRALVGAVLRRLGTLRHLFGLWLDRGPPPQAPRVETALLLGAAQILFLDVPDHAAVDLAVRLVQADRHAARFAGLVNAVLRRIAREGRERLAALDPVVLDTPPWLMDALESRPTARRPRAPLRPPMVVSRRSI